MPNFRRWRDDVVPEFNEAEIQEWSVALRRATPQQRPAPEPLTEAPPRLGPFAARRPEPAASDNVIDLTQYEGPTVVPDLRKAAETLDEVAGPAVDLDELQAFITQVRETTAAAPALPSLSELRAITDELRRTVAALPSPDKFPSLTEIAVLLDEVRSLREEVAALRALFE